MNTFFDTLRNLGFQRGPKRLVGGIGGGIARKYGFSITNLLGTAGPETMIRDLENGLGPDAGDVALHFYTFGGMSATAEWIAQHGGRTSA